MVVGFLVGTPILVVGAGGTVLVVLELVLVWETCGAIYPSKAVIMSKETKIKGAIFF